MPGVVPPKPFSLTVNKRVSSILDPVLDTVDSLVAWLSDALNQSTSAYCDLETAEDNHTLVSRDGSLASILQVEGVTQLIGQDEFDKIWDGLKQNLQTSLSRPGHAVQVFFSHDSEQAKAEIKRILAPAQQTATRLQLDLTDLFHERVNYLAQYCATETIYFVLWTRPASLAKERQKQAMKKKLKFIRKHKMPPFKNSQNPMAAFPDIRNAHASFVRALLNDCKSLNILAQLLDVRQALRAVRRQIDPEFTSPTWQPVLPGDKIPTRENQGDISDILWPPLTTQLIPRDIENLDLRTARIGNKLYSAVFIDLFPQNILPFASLFSRILATHIPWRMSYLLESNGLEMVRFKSMAAAVLSWTARHNRLINDATNMLRNIEVASDDAVIKLRVAFATWAPAGNKDLLRTRTAELAKAIQGWGSCEVGDMAGDAFAGVASSLLGMGTHNVATASVAPLSDVVHMLPFTRPASSWQTGALLLRSPDGKPWPFQPGSSQQTTWIDLIYARPGSGKSVLSNAINLALCLSPGIKRLPRMAIIDIGPSSSGLISLIKESLPHEQQHFAAHHRLRMTSDYAINPFDTQLGARQPTPQERSFLVNFLTLLATPISASKPYDGIPDMVGLIVDELYKSLVDNANPHLYTPNVEPRVDKMISKLLIPSDAHTTWWEITDALFDKGYPHQAMLAQRYAMPLLADAAAICRTPAIEDLYGKITAPTGEPLILAFARMISSAVREYPILAKVTQFDIGDSRIVSLDLDEVAKSGGEAAERQTAIMYMLARYVLARHYYLTTHNIDDMPEKYRLHHKQRIDEISEDPKRIVYDEFHRTAKTHSVREQVLLDMREGRKWNVQISLISQSVDDFDKTMIEFATSIFIMDAGPKQTIQRTCEIFGLSETAEKALSSRVHGPREGGATFLAQFATKQGNNIQLLTNTIGPIELWAFSTTTEDVLIRNKLYQSLNPKEARQLLARLFPAGSIKPLIETRLAQLKAEQAVIEELDNSHIVDQLAEKILQEYTLNPDIRHVVF